MNGHGGGLFLVANTVKLVKIQMQVHDLRPPVGQIGVLARPILALGLYISHRCSKVKQTLTKALEACIIKLILSTNVFFNGF